MFVQNVCVPVQDQDRARDFYTTKLGFKLKLDVAVPGEPSNQRWIELVSEENDVEVILFTQPGFENMIGKCLNIMFQVPNIQETYERFSKSGVEVSEPKTESWGTFCIFHDSEGNQFYVYESSPM